MIFYEKTYCYFLILIFTIFTISCKIIKKDKSVQDFILNLDSYKSEVEIEIYSNKGTSKYRQLQIYKSPDKVKIETLEPEFLKGKVMILNNGRFEIYHPLINQKFEGDILTEPTFIHLGIIQTSLLKNKEYTTTYTVLDGIETIKLRLRLEGDNIYKNEAIVYFTKKTLYHFTLKFTITVALYATEQSL
ncbi:hypothetical protein PL321_18630 [Caloramator sp. mosi_1]|uniref:hypothetical protein n=1 Tax=Caloramator sp. mosi_1 TaxID=3023090 RepID=UPI00235FD015|nr:hypothetical protein [Caloramator sp. mosi_1]WDC84219.1 hypothetical protein PL321_18630 [Caloramator sp. mosi_1]